MTTHGLIYSVWYGCHTSIQHVVIFETLQAKINRGKKLSPNVDKIQEPEICNPI